MGLPANQHHVSRTLCFCLLRFASALALGALVFATSPIGAAFAQDTNWTGSGGDNHWTNPANWSNGLPSGSGTSRVYGNHTVTVDGVAAGLNGWTYIGSNGSSAHVDVTNGGTLTGGCCFYLGSGGNGSMTVSGAGSLVSGQNVIFVVGQSSGTGELRIENGASAGAGPHISAIIGRYGGGIGIVTVDGAGSVFTSGRNLLLGGEVAGSTSNATGTLNLVNGGQVQVDSGHRDIFIAHSHGSTGTVNVGTGLAPGLISAANVRFGNGSGTLNFNHNANEYLFAPVIAGTGSINQLAGHTIIATNSSTFAGTTTVSGGTLSVNGQLGGTLNVGASGTLAGTGTVGGTVTVDGTLAAGASPGTLSIGGDLTLEGTSTTVFELNAPGLAGGANNDLVRVDGNLDLNGTLQATVANAGYYRLFDYQGSLTGAFTTRTVTSANAGFLLDRHALSTDIAGQVNLLALGAGQHMQFWDGSDTAGNGTVDGGAGVWDDAASNWTGPPGAANINDIWRGSVGVFGGSAGGNVTIGSVSGFDTLQFSTNGYILSGGELTMRPEGQDSTVAVDGGITATIQSVIVGDAGRGLRKTGTGTLILLGANRYTGGTVIEAGTLSGNTVSLTGEISNQGTVVFNQVTDGVFAGRISGSGGLTKSGAGTLNLEGTNDYTGGTIIEAGTLQGDADSLTGDIDNRSQLVFDQVEDKAFLGVISGSGSLVKQGAGALSLEADSSGYTGTTTVHEGKLLINGLLGGSLMMQGGTLGGTGRIATLELGSGSMLAPGNSIGTMNVGDLTLDAGSTYQVEINDGGNTPGVNNDVTDATGTVAIDSGATVHLKPVNGTDDGSTYTNGTVYTILTTTGDLTGTFDPTVTDDFALLDGSLSYNENSVFLTIAKTRRLDDIGRTPNQRAVGAAVEALGSSDPLYSALVVLRDEDDIAAGLNDLSGEIHASVQSVMTEGAHDLRDMIERRINDAFQGASAKSAFSMAPRPTAASGAVGEPAGPTVWFTAAGNSGNWTANSGAAGLGRTSAGIAAGLESDIRRGWKIGLTGGFIQTNYDLEGQASTGSMRSVFVGAYGRGNLGVFMVRYGGTYSWNSVETERTVAFPGFTNTLSADYDAGTGQLFAEIGYQMGASRMSLEPFAGLAFVQATADGFSETGGGGALNVDAWKQRDGYTTLGLQGKSKPFFSDGMKTQLTGRIAWRYALNDPSTAVQAALSGSGSFPIYGLTTARNVLELDIGVDIEVGHAATLEIDYRGEFGSGQQDHGASASIIRRF